MEKKLDLAIVDAIRSIIESTEHEVTYDIHKGEDAPFRRDKLEVIKVNITLTKPVDRK